MRNLNDVPTKWRTSLTNNGGGYVNHIFYWATMCPSHSSLPPSLVTAVKESFNGGIEKMKHLFTERAQTLFGSGYVWLVMDKDTNMKIITTKDQDTPMSIGLYPLLVLDVWEHSYYLKHQNKRGNYISDWWNVVCWGKVEDLRIMWLDRIQSDELIQLDANIIQKVDAKEL
jgi:Fe-Mn family superoxide dismutase